MPPRPPRLLHPHHRVSAVLVVHDGARWLPDVISTLAAQTRSLQRLVAVDVGSEDESPALLEAALGSDRIVRVDRRTAFADAVRAGVEHLDAMHSGPEVPRPRRRAGDELPQPDPVSWLWLIHDDCAPDPAALAVLLDAAEAAPSVGVLGPKVRDWDDPRLLVEVGLSIDHAGRRETGLERRELDQGQHDSRCDVLAVGTAGMLVRRDVWDALGGLEPRLPLLRDDIDFGWRANAAGYRVVVVPEARLRHARAVWTGRRPMAATHGDAHAVDRRHSLLSVLANLPTLALIGAFPRLILGALVRTLVFLLTRQVKAAGDEIAAVGWSLGHLGDLSRMRAARRATRRVPASQLRPLFVGRTARLRGYLDAFADWATGGARDSSFEGMPDDPDADVELPPEQGRAFRLLRSRPGLGLFLALALLAVVAARDLLGAGDLIGGDLLPAPEGARDLWRAYAASWHQVGAGTDEAASPAVAVLAMLAGLALGKARLAVTLLLLGAVPLASAAAYTATRRITDSVPVRLWVAATYAVLPVVTGAVAGGRLDAVVATIAAPLLVSGGYRLLSADLRQAGWRLPVGYGIGLAAATAFAPSMWLLCALGLGVGALVLLAIPSARSAGVRRLAAVAVALGTALVVLLPWSTRLVRAPRLLLAGTSSIGFDLTGSAPAFVELLLGRPGGPAMPPTWATVGVVAAAAAGLVRQRRQQAAIAGWLVALGAVGLALVTVRGAGGAEPGFPAAALAIAACGLLLAAAVGADGALERLGRYSFGWRQPVAAAVALAALAVPLICGLSWVSRGSADPLRRQNVHPLPSVVLAEADRIPGMRVLWLDEAADGSVRYTLTTAQGRGLPDAGLPVEESTVRALDGLVRDLSSTRGTNAAEALATFNVRYVAVPNPVSPLLATGLDAQAGLSRVAFVAPVQLWQTLTPAGRVTLLSPPLARVAVAGRVAGRDELRLNPPVPLSARGRESARATVPPGPPGRVVVLAERADDRWIATLDGKRLARTTVYGWAQAFGVPEAGGVLEIRRDGSARRTALRAQAAVLLVALVLAAPPIRRRDDDEDEPPPVAAPDVEPEPLPTEVLVPVNAGNVRRLS